jgi:hypothetical protein
VGDVGVAAPTLGIRVERILRVLRSSGTHHHGGEIGLAVDHLEKV